MSRRDAPAQAVPAGLRLLVTAVAAACVAGCGAARSASAPADGQSSSSALPPVASASVASAPVSAGATPRAPASPGYGCGVPASPSYATDQLTGIEFVSPARGWAVGQGAILVTADGGAHWTAQLTGRLDLSSVDFVNADDGWATGANSLLATTDGGAHWTPLPEPCPLIRSVHFTSPSVGYAVAGGSGPVEVGFGTWIPWEGGVVLVTHDGGRDWAGVGAPANAQSVCFETARDGWLGAGGLLYRTRDGGETWTSLSAATPGSRGRVTADMSVECAGSTAVWAVRSLFGGGMNQQPHVAYHADASGLTGVYSEARFRGQGDPTANSPGGYAGPFSVLSPQASVFIDSCAPCDGFGTAPWAVATRSGAALAEEGTIGGISTADAAAFLSPRNGWVAGVYNKEINPTKSRYQQRIVATTDGGKTWQTEWASPWTDGFGQ